MEAYAHLFLFIGLEMSKIEFISLNTVESFIKPLAVQIYGYVVADIIFLVCWIFLVFRLAYNNIAIHDIVQTQKDVCRIITDILDREFDISDVARFEFGRLCLPSSATFC